MKVSLRNPLARVLAACSVVLVTVVACSNSPSATHAALSGGCYVNSDCNAPLKCAFQRCHTECSTSRDCPGGTTCVASDRPFHVCQLGVEKNCSYNSDCPIGQVCGVDQNCRDQCKTSSDCVPGQVCTQGTCADPEQLEGGRLPVVASDASFFQGDDSGGAPTGTSCVYNSDCATGQICLNQACVPECKQDVDCIFKGPGYQCVASQCVVAMVEAGADATTDASPACIYNSDCPSPQICAYGACVPQCREDRDCASGQTCRSAVCVGAPVEASSSDGSSTGPACVYNSDCPSPQICINGGCVPQCKQDRDCASGQTCVNSVCTSTLPEASTSGPDATSDAKSCAYNSDCTPQICSGGVCIDQCHTDVDCPSGETCNGAHVCVTPEASVPVNAPDGYGGGCVYNSDCPVPLVCKSNGSCGYQCVTNPDCASGQYCSVAHQCIFGTPPAVDAGAADAASDATVADGGKLCTYNSDCSDGLWCNGIEQCINSHCAPATDTPCNTHATCVTSTCTEPASGASAGTCAYANLGSMDADGDGHYDQACGGDDCNDFDKTVYTGAPELCDGKDNDCNGLVDDYAVVARGTEYTSGAAAPAGTSYGWSPFSQAMTSAFGTGLLTGYWVNNSGAQWTVRSMTASGVGSAAFPLFTPTTYVNYDKLAGFGASTTGSPAAVLVYNNENGGGGAAPLYATVITQTTVDGGTGYTNTAPVTLVPNGWAWAYYAWVNEADVDWIPATSQFLVSWSRLNSASNTVGYFATLNTDGTLATSLIPVPTPVPDGGVASGILGNGGTSAVYLRSAVNGSLFAFTYGQWTAYYSTAPGGTWVTGLSGNVIAGPINVPGMPLDVAAYKSGFVVLSQSSSGVVLTQISSTGAVLATATAQSLTPALGFVVTDARGEPDSNGGIVFALRTATGFNSATQGSVRMVRARINAQGTFDPVEVSTPLQPVTPSGGDRLDLSVLSDGRLALSYWEPGVDNAVHVRILSCLP